MRNLGGGWLVVGAAVAIASGSGCGREVGGPSTGPATSTWVDVSPILRGQCNHCHGSGAATFGGGTRFDFYEMSDEICGPAAAALDPALPLGRGYAEAIWEAITTTSAAPEVRPRMPPEPARFLEEWEWSRIGAWVKAGAPKGDPPPENRPPRIALRQDVNAAARTVRLDVTVEDPDGDAVVGVLTVGDVALRMDRAGAFSASLDLSGGSGGDRPIEVVLCDGWVNVRSVVGTVTLSGSP